MIFSFCVSDPDDYSTLFLKYVRKMSGKVIPNSRLNKSLLKTSIQSFYFIYTEEAIDLLPVLFNELYYFIFGKVTNFMPYIP